MHCILVDYDARDDDDDDDDDLYLVRNHPDIIHATD